MSSAIFKSIVKSSDKYLIRLVDFSNVSFPRFKPSIESLMFLVTDLIEGLLTAKLSNRGKFFVSYSDRVLLKTSRMFCFIRFEDKLKSLIALNVLVKDF